MVGREQGEEGEVEGSYIRRRRREKDDGGENGARSKGDESMLVLKCVCVCFHVIM